MPAAEELKEIALGLHDLRHERNLADYEMDCVPIESAEKAKITLERTRTQISEFNAICGDEVVMASNWSAMKDAAHREHLGVSEQ